MTILKNDLPKQINSGEELWFFDESRFGTHSKVGHAWYKTGVRTPVKIKVGYQNFYLYSAVNHKTGEEFTLILPKVNTVCMNIFLTEFAQNIQGRKVVLIMDGAAWHKSKALTIPDQMRIIIQPPYSPELNPVEKFWQYIKNNTIKNQLFDNLNKLEKALTTFLNTINPCIITKLCNVNYI